MQKAPRRYRDLDQMIQKLHPNVDPRTYWSYGCHCFSMDDRPMSGKKRGKPVDKLDHFCQTYGDCQKCVQKQFGSVCTTIVSFVKRFCLSKYFFEKTHI
jgi:hypothetical protein